MVAPITGVPTIWPMNGVKNEKRCEAGEVGVAIVILRTSSARQESVVRVVSVSDVVQETVTV